MIVIPDEGKIELLGKTLRAALAVDESYSLRLFRNDITPAAGSTLASFTEASFLGYFRYDLTRAGWTVPAIVDGRAVTEWTAAEVKWTAADGPQTLYGYYVIAPATAKVAWAERFTDPRVMEVGSTLQIIPRLTGRSQV
jgi:hypothetical protein